MAEMYVAELALIWWGLHVLTLRRWAAGWRKASASATLSHSQPQLFAPFTVLIPSRNESQRVLGLLDDLAHQSAPNLFKVVLVDDHSEDFTAALATEHPIHPQVVTAQGIGKKSALLEGLVEADTQWVVTVDADARLDAHWAQSWSAALHEVSDDVSAIAGPVVFMDRVYPSSLWSRIQAIDFAAQMGWSASQIAQNRPASASGSNLAVRAKDYPDTRHLGASGDDTLVVQALHRDGKIVEWLHDQQARVWSPGAQSMAEWVSQRLRWAGKTKHYPWPVMRTAWWMAGMSLFQWVLLAWAAWAGTMVAGGVAAGWWAMVTVANVRFSQPIARWMGLTTKNYDWLVLGLTQPTQLPILVLARLGLLRVWGISSHPKWKGRTCTT